MSSRADDLTADLLHDLTAEAAAPAAPPAPSARPERPEGRPSDDAAAFVETDFFLAPRSWKRPGVGRDGDAVAFRAGPVQVRIGRRR